MSFLKLVCSSVCSAEGGKGRDWDESSERVTEKYNEMESGREEIQGEN